MPASVTMCFYFNFLGGLAGINFLARFFTVEITVGEEAVIRWIRLPSPPECKLGG